MSIRLRLILSYIAMLIIPILLFVLSLIILLLAFLGDLIDIKDYYNIDSKKGSIEAYFDEKSILYGGLRNIAVGNSERLEDPELLADYERRLSRQKVSMVIVKQAKVTYQSPELDISSIEALRQREEESREHYAPFLHQGKHYYITRYELLEEGRILGSLYLLQDITPLQALLMKAHPTLYISFALALILTGGGLTYLVSRSIMKPVQELKLAAERMKEGNLDVPMRTDRKDELGQLSRTFEEMRVKLKESIELRLQDEENRKQLISNITHDIKTPITAIKGYVEGIIDGVAKEPEKLDRYIRTIYTKTNDLDKLIDELFLYSKLDLKRMPFHMERINGQAFLQDCLEEVKVDLDKKGIQFQYDWSHEKEPFTLLADREKLKRAIVNIVENSCKFMDKTPAAVAFRISLASHHVRLEIADNGRGIGPEALPYIFDRFYRADPSRNSAQGGSGLGLAITKQIIEAHRGSVLAESVLGEGTTIIMLLPVQEGSYHETDSDYRG